MKPCVNGSLISLFAGVAVLFAAQTHLGAATVTVFAGSSLSDALQEIAVAYQRQSSDRIGFNFAGSGTLARQIEAGAPADIFFSADETRTEVLERQGLLVPETRLDRLGNSLAIVATPENLTIHSPQDLTNSTVQRVALGDVKSVPAGAYARAYLEPLGLWPGVAAKLVACESVRAVLAAVESGNVEAGIVYRTDAALSKKVRIAFAVPPANGPKIVYPMALVKDSPQPAAARKFFLWLNSPAAGRVFEKFGFTVLTPTAPP